MTDEKGVGGDMVKEVGVLSDPLSIMHHSRRTVSTYLVLSELVIL